MLQKLFSRMETDSENKVLVFSTGFFFLLFIFFVMCVVVISTVGLTYFFLFTFILIIC